jgi:hypothetical protein
LPRLPRSYSPAHTLSSAMRSGRPPGQPYIQIAIPGIPGVGPPPPQDREYRGWREHCEHLRDRERDLRDRLAYMPPCSEERGRLEHRLAEVHHERESSAGAVENQNGSDFIPGDEPGLARFGTAHDGPSAVTEADTHPAAFFCGCARSRIAVDEADMCTKLWRLFSHSGYWSYERDRWFESSSLLRRVGRNCSAASALSG